MKTKLLKRIRDRFTITFYPKGLTVNKGAYNFYNSKYAPVFVLYDNDKIFNSWTFQKCYDSADEEDYQKEYKRCKELAYEQLVYVISECYSKYGTRRIAAKKKLEKENELRREKSRQAQLDAGEVIWYNNKK